MCVRFYRLATPLLSLSFLALSFSSCVKQEYDLNKEFDGTAVLMKDISMPVGDLKKITVQEILSTEGEQTISTDEKGDYTFTFQGGDPFAAKLSIPSFQIPLEDGTSGDEHSITYLFGALEGKNGVEEDLMITLANQRLEKIIRVPDEDRLPYQIIDVKEADINTIISYDLSVSEGAIYLMNGFMMDFPDWLVLEKNDTDPSYIVENQGDNKNIVRFKDNLKVEAGNPFSLNLKVTKINIPEGSIIDGGNDSEGRPCKKIMITETPENMVVATGSIYFYTADFPTIPEKASLTMKMVFTDFYVESASVMLNMEMSVPDQEVPITAYPDFFNSEGLVLDIYDSFLKFDINNGLPTALDLNADFRVFKNSEERMNLHIGDNGTGDNKFSIPALWEGSVVYSRLGKGEGEIMMPELGELINLRPDHISVSNINLAAAKEYITITSEQEFECMLGYSLFAPLAFGKDLNISYDIDVNDIDLNLGEVGISKAEITLNVTNSIPLNFNMQAIPLDQTGNEIQGLTLNVDRDVPPGTQASPVTVPLKIALTSDGSDIKMNSLKLRLSATCPDEAYQGIPLNVNQGLEVKDLALRLPEGLTVDINEIFGETPVE